MKLIEITKVLETIAPLELAEEWDNVGLLTGDYEQATKRIMLTIDMTAEVLAEAQAKKVDLIVAYHPPIWEPLKKIVAGQGMSPLLYDAIRSRIAIYSLHTALDSARGGVNDALAEVLGIEAAQPLHQPDIAAGSMCKLVVFVPEPDLEKVSTAIFTAGAGHVGPEGKYSKCSFRTRGTGTFQCGPASKPAIGKPGRFEEVEEFRLESIVPQNKLSDVVKAMLQTHPYEEVAYDVFALMSMPAETGLGRYGCLTKPVTVGSLVDKIKKSLKVKTVGLIAPRRGLVKTAAVCAGSCGAILRNVIRQKCDFYLTGELKHHHGLELQEAGVTTVCVGHSFSERIILPRIAGNLRRHCPKVNVILSRKDHDPFTWC